MWRAGYRQPTRPIAVDSVDVHGASDPLPGPEVDMSPPPAVDLAELDRVMAQMRRRPPPSD